MNNRYYLVLASIVLILIVSVFVYNTTFIKTPTVYTITAEVEEDVVSIKGIVTDLGRKQISEYGFIWGTSNNLENHIVVGMEIDKDISFNTIIENLEEGATYYYQAYATNSKGQAYGEVKSFTMPVNEPPSLSITILEDKLSFIQGELVNISATAVDDKKVESVELFINNTSKVKVNNESLSFKWNTNNISPGEYLLRIVAWDGAKSGEQEIKLVVEKKPEPVPKPIANVIPNTPNPVQESTSNTQVSRGTTDINKYPKLSKVNGVFGQFRYRSLANGRIEIDPVWVQQNIVTITLPGLSQKVQVHRLAKDNFIHAFTLIQNESVTINGRTVPLLSLIQTMDGTFVPRHVAWSPSRGLSNHSWGTAIDINAAGHFRYVNPATEPNNPNLILWEKAFKPAGFSWGNRFNDAMHYEIIR